MFGGWSNKQLQTNRMLMFLRSKCGVIIPNANQMAEEISALWSNAMSSMGKSRAQCSDHLQTFFGSKSMEFMSHG